MSERVLLIRLFTAAIFLVGFAAGVAVGLAW